MGSSRTPSTATEAAAVLPDFSALPVLAMKDKIVEKIMENRVTLIVGETGCGKSSQVPQFLLEKNIEPILCTQPRRFAVVTVAKMVASIRKCEVGEEVGYHIGHSRAFSSSSKIVFKTAGVLLDEMQEKGLNALKYKVIILDEVHERSVESDLVLVCIKQFLLKKNDLRVVLMSATADITRYREYFKDLGRGERVEVLAIPSTEKNISFQKEVLYLDQVNELLGMNCESLSSKYCSGPSPKKANAVFGSEVHHLIHDLILHTHKTEPDIEKSILVFLPTYQSLEQQWSLLKPFSHDFKVHILHRSIDTEQALKSMKIWKSHRKVILATNIAESSVTIPKVGYVIDSCRSLQVFWDNNRKTDSAELVWVSKSQAEQRRGRTGRTCDGLVYRLVTEAFYGQLDDFESPALLKLSLRQQTLLLCCANSRIINDPKALFQKAMDPPDHNVVQDALDLLVQMKALEKPYRGRYAPTFYGQLLSSFSLSFNASVLILKLANMGMLREGILFGILMDLQPLPIHRPFGQAMAMDYTDSYYRVNSKNAVLGATEVLYMANFCAFYFWQRSFKDTCRFNRLRNIFNINETKEMKSLLRNVEEEWCSFHELVLPALEQITETYDEIINSLHRYRPKCLVISNSIPIYYEPSGFQHSCVLDSMNHIDTGSLSLKDEEVEYEDLPKCIAVPFVGPGDFCVNEVSKWLGSTVKEMRIQLAVDVSKHPNEYVYQHNGHEADMRPPLCRYFANGTCNRGFECPFSHELSAKKPPCNFFLSLKGCRNGDSCFFSHDVEPTTISYGGTNFCLPEEEVANAETLLELFPAPSEGVLLVMDDMDLRFSSNLAHLYESSCIVSTTSQHDPFTLNPPLDEIQVLWGLSHPYQTIMARQGENKVPWEKVKCVLWVPSFANGEEIQQIPLQNFFSYLAIRILANSLEKVEVILTMNNLRFSRMQVETIARTTSSSSYHHSPTTVSFGELPDTMKTTKSDAVSMPICYVFELHPPNELEFGEHASELKRHFYPIQPLAPTIFNRFVPRLDDNMSIHQK